MNENVVVKTKNSKGLIALVIILLISVIGLISFIVYDKVITEDSNNNEKVTEKTNNIIKEDSEEETEKIKIDKYLTFNSKIKKVYKGTSNYPIDEQTSKFEEQTLYLYENGQYYLSISSVIDSGEIGYYEESDNIIILYSVFSHDAKMDINYGESTGIVTSIYKESDDKIISSKIGDNDQFILEKDSADTNKINQIKETFSKYDENECKKNYYCSQKQ